MNTTKTDTLKQKNKRSQKKQKSFVSRDLGTPLVPVRQRPKKHEPELLSDWDHAS